MSFSYKSTVKLDLTFLINFWIQISKTMHLIVFVSFFMIIFSSKHHSLVFCGKSLSCHETFIKFVMNQYLVAWLFHGMCGTKLKNRHALVLCPDYTRTFQIDLLDTIQTCYSVKIFNEFGSSILEKIFAKKQYINQTTIVF